MEMEREKKQDIGCNESRLLKTLMLFLDSISCLFPIRVFIALPADTIHAGVFVLVKKLSSLQVK